MAGDSELVALYSTRILALAADMPLCGRLESPDGTGTRRAPLCGSTVTVETVTPMLDKTLPGFGELFRSLSYQEIGTASMLSRAVAGVKNGTIIICIPGSLGAAKTAVEKIVLPEIGHMVREASR